MPINYKFIAIQVDSKINLSMKHKDEIIDNYIDYNIIKNYFLKIGKEFDINDDDIANIKFIINNQNISLTHQQKYLINDDITIIYIVAIDNLTKFKLLNIFSKYGHNTEVKNSLNKIEMIPETIEPTTSTDDTYLTDEIIQKSNEETIKLFKDKDFNTLLQIYKNNPTIFNVFSSYISNGDVIINSPEVTDSSITNSESFTEGELLRNNTSESFEYIKSLNLSITDQSIIDALKINNGHMNLTLRYLLYNLDKSII